MAGVKFATISDLDKDTIALIREIIKTDVRLVITRRGKPVGLLRKIKAGDKGIKEPLTHLVNNANDMLSTIESGGKQIVITRYDLPVVVLKKITDKAFSIKE